MSRVRTPSIAHFRHPVHTFEALLLGIVQGITEFFPVSSSAHLRLVRYFLGLPEGQEWLYFDLACHAGTWTALVFFLRKEIWQVLCDVRKIALFTLALLPLIPSYFLLKSFRSPAYTGYFLLLTALLLFLASKNRAPTQEKKWTSVLFIGMMQGLALLPGLSRSGSTIAVARFCKWEWIDAAKFSFLLAVPTILGGEILESWKLIQSDAPKVFLSDCAVGFIASLAVGLIAVRFVFFVYQRAKVQGFAWYCLCLGLLMIWMLNG